PERLSQNSILERTGAVIVVAPYGRPICQDPWIEFSKTFDVPVVIDAAAGFDALLSNSSETIGDLPVVVSLHATKVFAVGEGGLILCRDTELNQKCASSLNFGF